MQHPLMEDTADFGALEPVSGRRQCLYLFRL
jgi:hypothetical protein